MADVLRTIRLTKHFGDFTALDSLDLEIAPGEVVGYLGPNGAGKTVTIRLILGLLRPSAGRVELFGQDARRGVSDTHRRLAYVPGEAALWPGLSGAETLDFLARLHGSVDGEYRDQLIERFKLDADKKVRAYSKGNRQKVNLIAALASRAELLILDEPTSGLDPLMEAEFRECCREARERGQAIFLSSHVLSEIEALCDRVGILREGRLIDIGTLAQMRHLSALRIEATFAGSPPDLSGVEGVESIRVAGNVLSCQVQGAVGPVLERLAKAEVTELISREPSLEELFLAHYGNGE
jgi:polyether ionophore transport system ATP-binding protein